MFDRDITYSPLIFAWNEVITCSRPQIKMSERDNVNYTQFGE